MSIFLIIGLAFWDASFLIGFGLSGTALFTASLLFLNNGELTLPLIWIGAFLGAAAGDHASYAVGRFFGSLLEAKFSERVGRKIAQSRRFVLKYGAWGIVIGRFFWATRKIIPFVCGSTGLAYRRFLVADILACAAWVTVWCTVLQLVSKYGFDIFQQLHSYLF